MIICCIGDSLTEGDYGIKDTVGIANVQEKGYPYFLRETTGAEVRNYGKCGWRSTTMLARYEKGGLNLSGADKIVLMLGTNGGQRAAGDSEENTAYCRLVEHILHDQPQAQLYLATPPNATVNPKYSNCGYMPQVIEAQGFVRRIAQVYGLPVIDVGADLRITPATEDELQCNDGLHFVEVGYRVLAEVIREGIGL